MCEENVQGVFGCLGRIERKKRDIDFSVGGGGKN